MGDDVEEGVDGGCGCCFCIGAVRGGGVGRGGRRRVRGGKESGLEFREDGSGFDELVEEIVVALCFGEEALAFADCEGEGAEKRGEELLQAFRAVLSR